MSEHCESLAASTVSPSACWDKLNEAAVTLNRMCAHRWMDDLFAVFNNLVELSDTSGLTCFVC